MKSDKVNRKLQAAHDLMGMMGWSSSHPLQTEKVIYNFLKQYVKSTTARADDGRSERQDRE